MDKKNRTQIGGPEDPREGLEAAQVENAFVAGWSWAKIAEVLGVSKQAVHKKHAKRIRDRYPGEPPKRKGRGA